LKWAQAILVLDPNRHEQIATEIIAALTNEFPLPAERPLFSALDCDRSAGTFGLRLPAWEAGLPAKPALSLPKRTRRVKVAIER